MCAGFLDIICLFETMAVKKAVATSKARAAALKEKERKKKAVALREREKARAAAHKAKVEAKAQREEEREEKAACALQTMQAKRSSECMSPLAERPTKMPQVETEDGTIQLIVAYATSGGTLTKVQVPATSSVLNLKTSLLKTLGPGKLIGDMLLGDTILQEKQSLKACGLTDGDEVKVILQPSSKPKLFIEKDIECFDSDDELCDSDEEGPGSDKESDADGVTCCSPGIDASPEIAREVAKAMIAELGDANIACGSESDSPGAVAVITNPGGDARRACLRALRTPKNSEHLWDRSGDEHEDNINEDGEKEPPMWSISQCEETDWSQMLEDGFDGSGDSAILNVTKIMNEKLEKHFYFGFTDAIVVAPIFYGGYASDGNIVGVLTHRVWT